jgi:hypothetical protein
MLGVSMGQAQQKRIKQITKHRLALVAVRDFRGVEGGTQSADNCTFFYGSGYSNHCLQTGAFVHKGETNDLETNSKNRNIRDKYRDTSEFSKCYQRRTNLVKDGDDSLLVGSDNILNRWKNYFSRVLNVHGVNDVRQAEIHTDESLVPELCSFKVEIVIEI